MDDVLKRYPSSAHAYRVRKLAVERALEGDYRLLDTVVDRLLNDVPGRSSPGAPYFQFGARNADLIRDYRPELVEGVRTRIVFLCKAVPRAVNELDARGLVSLGLCDIVRVFVKNEPHKREKIQSLRERLIMSISLVDQVVERFLYAPQNRLEVERWTECPSSPGIGFDDETNRVTFGLFKPYMDTGILRTSDISGWDWCYKPWLEYADCEIRVKLAGLDHDHPLANAMRTRSLCALRSVFSLSDGRLFELGFDGIMKSGRYVTSSTNSRARVLLADVVQLRQTGQHGWCRSMGDDAGESHADGAVDAYEALGFRVKEYEECDGQFEFCSHLYKDGRAEPLTWAKTLYRYLSQSERTADLRAQFLYEIRDCPLCPDIIRALELSGDRESDH